MKKKENIVIIVMLIVMILAIIGVSYAAFNFSGTGNVVNKITTGAITMTYEESDNTISLGNALPTTDKTGKVRLKEGEYFDFTVSSTVSGNVNINYEISAKEVGDGTIDGSNIKLYLTRLNGDSEEELMTPELYNEEVSSNSYTGRPANEMSLYTSSMNSSERNTYRLRMWVDEDYNPQGDGGNLTFTVQVNVYGKAGDKMYWKIVRVNGDGSLRLIYNGTSVTPDFSDLSHSYEVGIAPYSLNHTESKYSGYTYDNGTDNFVKREVDTWYENVLGDTIYDSMVTGGRFCSDSSGYKDGNDYNITNVFDSMVRIGQSLTNYTTNNYPTLICPDTDETYGGSYRLNAGLITADELVLAGESLLVTSDNYLNSGEDGQWYWTMTPAAFNIDHVNVWRAYSDFASMAVSVANVAIRPVINVTADNGFTKGDGTVSAPYGIL